MNHGSLENFANAVLTQTHTHSQLWCLSQGCHRYIEQEHTQETDRQERQGSEDNQEGSLREGQANISNFYQLIIMLLAAVVYNFLYYLLD